MTRRDWESVRVQVQTGMCFTQFELWLKGQQEKKVKEIVLTKVGEADRLIGELKSFTSVAADFKVFVENQINNSKEVENE